MLDETTKLSAMWLADRLAELPVLTPEERIKASLMLKEAEEEASSLIGQIEALFNDRTSPAIILALALACSNHAQRCAGFDSPTRVLRVILGVACLDLIEAITQPFHS